MIKLTKKQNEIIAQVKQIEEETGETVHLMYNELSKKIHAVIIRKDENGVIKGAENKGIICTHTVAQTMEQKGIVVPEVVGKHKLYSSENTLYDFTLCRLNYEQIA